MNSSGLDRREFLKKTLHATAAMAAYSSITAAVAPVLARAGEAGQLRGSRISYYCNGEIYVSEVGKPEGKPLTTGHWDFKPSWSKTCLWRIVDFSSEISNSPQLAWACGPPSPG